MNESYYSSKAAIYYANARHEILPLLPPNVGRVLDVGCGTGETLALLKQDRGCSWAGGVELFPNAAQEARSRVDQLFEGDIEKIVLPIQPESLDVILCLDVLEHLINPWEVMTRLTDLLKPGGILIASIPNVRYAKVSLSLVFSGTWDYTDKGILDRTHLRFFTRSSAINLIESPGLKVDEIRCTGVQKGGWGYWINMVTFSLMRQLLEIQYVIRARKSAGNGDQAGC